MKKTANYETGSFEKKTANGDFLSSKKTAKKRPMAWTPGTEIIVIGFYVSR